MTDREQLIEEAAKAILDVAEMPESVRDERVCEWARRDARAALAVFEKAEAADWEYREQVIAGFPRPKNVRIERQRRRPAGPWEQVPDDYTTPKEEA